MLPAFHGSGRLVLALVFSLAACTTESSQDATQASDTWTDDDAPGPDSVQVAQEALKGLAEDGAYRAGYRELEVTYTPTGQEAPRTLVLGIWYPTNDTSGTPASYLGLLEQDDVFADATLAPPPVAWKDSYRLHVHSHGHRGFAGATPYLMRHFATHGWIVAAPHHTGNTLVDNIEPRPPWMYVVRARDITAVLDTLAALPEEDPLAGKVDTSEVLMSGHSFGGYTTYAVVGASFDPNQVEEVCAAGCSEGTLNLFESGVQDPRVVAAIPMAAGNRSMFGDAGYGSIAVPLLMMTGDDDDSVKNEGQGDAIWGALNGKDAVRVDVAGGCHQLFGLGACHKIDDDEGFRIVKVYTLAFAAQRLLGDQAMDPILDGSVEVSDKVTLSQHYLVPASMK